MTGGYRYKHNNRTFIPEYFMQLIEGTCMECMEERYFCSSKIHIYGYISHDFLLTDSTFTVSQKGKKGFMLITALSF